MKNPKPWLVSYHVKDNSKNIDAGRLAGWHAYSRLDPTGLGLERLLISLNQQSNHKNVAYLPIISMPVLSQS